jgi:hypothetical protein
MINPILQEIHEARRQLMQEHPHDLAAFIRAELEASKRAGHPMSNIKLKTLNLESNHSASCEDKDAACLPMHQPE